MKSRRKQRRATRTTTTTGSITAAVGFRALTSGKQNGYGDVTRLLTGPRFVEFIACCTDYRNGTSAVGMDYIIYVCSLRDSKIDRHWIPNGAAPNESTKIPFALVDTYRRFRIVLLDVVLAAIGRGRMPGHLYKQYNGLIIIIRKLSRAFTCCFLLLFFVETCFRCTDWHARHHRPKTESVKTQFSILRKRVFPISICNRSYLMFRRIHFCSQYN